MRLDHLLSKETSSNRGVSCNVLRSDLSGGGVNTLFNLEGAHECERYGPIAQLARAHD